MTEATQSEPLASPVVRRPPWQTMAELLWRNEAQFPDLPAVTGEGRSVSYGAYLSRARRLADAMAADGIRPGDVVSIMARNCMEYLDVYAACEISGVILAPFNFRLAGPEVLSLADKAEPRLLFADAEALQTVALLRDRMSTVRRLVALDDRAGTGADRFEDYLGSGRDRMPAHRPRAEDIAYIMFTSGTTGRPKGTIRSHGASFRAAELLAAELTGPQCGASLLMTPLFHVGGKDIRASQLWRAGTSVLLSQFEPRAVLRAIHDHRVATFFLVATQLQELVNQPDLSDFDLTSLTGVSIAGAPCPVPLLTRAIELFGRVFVVQYGMTEGLIASMQAVEFDPRGTERQRARIASAGRSIPQGQMCIRDEAGRHLATNEIGEICARSEVMFEGYWRDPDLSASALSDGWFRTGDLGRMDENGYVFIVDRKKDMIITGGENVYSREVENALLDHPGVQDAAVIGAPDPKWGERIVAFVVAAPGQDPTAEQLADHAAALIARYKCPRQIEFVPHLPLTTNGKIDKVALRTRLAALSAVHVEGDTP